MYHRLIAAARRAKQDGQNPYDNPAPVLRRLARIYKERIK